MTGRTTADTVGSVVNTADPGGLLRVYEAASMYYAQGETTGVITRHLGVSRSVASQPLVRAHQEGVVWVSPVQPGGTGSLEGQMAQASGVRTHTVPMCEGTTGIHRLGQVTSVATMYMVDLIKALAESGQDRGVGVSESGGPGGDRPPVASESARSGQDTDAGDVVVGVAQGTIMSEISAALSSRSTPGPTVVQFSGASDPVREGPSADGMSSRMCLLLEARTTFPSVSVFFDYVVTREAMWSKRSIRRVLSVVWHASLAVFGVGVLDAFNEALPSQVYEGDHLTTRDRAVLRRQNVVGDIHTVLLCADGSRRDVTLNARTTGPIPTQLARIPRRLCMATGVGKSHALLVALRARIVTDLAVNDAIAHAILELIEACGWKEGGSQ